MTWRHFSTVLAAGTSLSPAAFAQANPADPPAPPAPPRLGVQFGRRLTRDDVAHARAGDPGHAGRREQAIPGARGTPRVGAPTNFGIVPIAVLPLKLSDKLVYFFELDLPLFLRDNPALGKAEASATVLFQSGFGF